MKEDFTPLTDVIIKIKYFLFGEDILVKTIDNVEYHFDKIVEEWVPSNLLNTYQEKNILPKEITKEISDDIIANLKIKNLSLKKELDFEFIEELVSGRKSFIVTNEKTNKSFHIESTGEYKKRKNILNYVIIPLIITLVFICSLFTLNNLKTASNSKKVATDIVETITLKNIVIIKNTPLPNAYSKYINEKLSDNIISSLKIDTSDVKLDTAGMYTYKIIYDEKEYVGVVIVVNNESEKNQTLDQLENPEKYTK